MNALFMVIASVATVILFTLNLSANQIYLAVGITNIPIYFTIKKVIKNRNKND